MRLLRISRIKWEVLAILVGDSCPLLDTLSGIDGSVRAVEQMYTMLLEDVPARGPRRDNDHFCSPLGDGLFQFKRGPKKGQKLRVPFFYAPGRRVVCTEAAMKTNVLRGAVIDRAHSHHLAFKTALNEDNIKILDMGDLR